MSERFGVAIVGLGIGEQHARAFHADPRCRIEWLCDLDLQRAQTLQNALGVGKVAPDVETILNCPRTQIISLATYDDQHAAQVLAALRAGKHVFVEKPLCRSLDELRQIKKALQNGPVKKLGCNLVLRAAPLYLWLKEKMARGELGDIYAFDGDYLYGRLHKIADGWRRNVEDYSVMQGGGIHILDQMLWLTGQRPASVTATGNRLCTTGTAFRYNDYVAATFCFQSGMIGRITANFGCVHRHQHVFRVFGTKGTFIYDDAGPRFHSARDPERKADQVALAALPGSKGDLISSFVSSILHNSDATAETGQIFDGISLAVACDRAVASQKEERIAYP